MKKSSTQRILEEAYRKEMAGELKDEKNPNYALQGMHNELLVLIASGALDAKELAELQLKNKYLAPDGSWVGPQGLKKAWGDN